MGNRHMKKMLMIAIHQKMWIKITMKFYLTTVRMAVIEKSENSKDIGETLS